MIHDKNMSLWAFYIILITRDGTEGVERGGKGGGVMTWNKVHNFIYHSQRSELKFDFPAKGFRSKGRIPFYLFEQ